MWGGSRGVVADRWYVARGCELEGVNGGGFVGST